MRMIAMLLFVVFALVAGLMQPAAADDSFGFETYLERYVPDVNVQDEVRSRIQQAIPNAGTPPVNNLSETVNVGDMTAPDGANPATVQVPAPISTTAPAPPAPLVVAGSAPREWPGMLHLGENRLGLQTSYEREAEQFRVAHSHNLTTTAFHGGGEISSTDESITVQVGRFGIRGRTSQSHSVGLGAPTPSVIVGPQLSWDAQSKSSELAVSYALGRDTRLGASMKTSDPGTVALRQGGTTLATGVVESREYSFGLHQNLGKDVSIGLVGSQTQVDSTYAIRGDLFRATTFYRDAHGQLDRFHGQIDAIPDTVRALARELLNTNREEAEARIDAELPTYLDRALSHLPGWVPDTAREQARQQALSAWQTIVRPELVRQWEHWAAGIEAEAVRRAEAALPGLHQRVEDARNELEGAIPRTVTVGGKARIQSATMGIDYRPTHWLRVAANIQVGKFSTGQWSFPYKNASASLEVDATKHFTVSVTAQGTAPGVGLRYHNRDTVVEVRWQRAHPALEYATNRKADSWQFNASWRF